MPPQLSYPLSPPPAQPGQNADLSGFNGDIVTGIASVLIPFGVLCEFILTGGSAGLVRPVQDLTGSPWTSAKMIGVSLWGPEAVEQGYVLPSVPYSTSGSSASGYPKGAAVPFMRRGRIWMAFDGGGTITRLGAVNVWHSSDGTNPQGAATFTATATTAGAEIDVMPAGISLWNPDNTAAVYTDGFGDSNGIVRVAVNF